MVDILVIAAFGVVGIVLGIVGGRHRAGLILAAASTNAKGLVEEAKRTAKLRKRTSQTEGQEVALKVASDAAAEHAQLQEAVDQARAEFSAVEQEHAEQLKELNRIKSIQGGRLRQIKDTRAAAKAVFAEKDAAQAEALSRLEERSDRKADELTEQMAEQLIEAVRSEGADQLRNLESNQGDLVDRQAKRILSIAMQRYADHYMRVRTGSTIALSDIDHARLTANEGKLVADLKERTGAELQFAEDNRSVRIETGDGIAREVCRRVIKRTIQPRRGRAKQDDVIGAVQKDVAREIKTGGEKAFKALRLKPAHEEIIDLMGRLAWRTSYTQNQYRHSIEVGHLAGMIAAELGLRVKVARRGALMHDMGKSLTHKVEGSHALLGAELARKHGELEEVANAIGAHHGEEPMNSAYAWLVAGCDAMSGGRPGARREQTESYGDRIGDLERISSRFDGVESVHAVQAGREIRVHVDQKRVNDAALEKLSTDIAEKISEEMTFPGQIRVTVIRQFVASENAR